MRARAWTSRAVLVVQEVLLCSVTWVVALPIFVLIVLPTFLLFVIYKLVVNLIVRVKHPEWCGALSGPDACLANMGTVYKFEGKLLNNIGLMLELEGDLDLQFLRSEFKRQVLDAESSSSSSSDDSKPCRESDRSNYKYSRLRKRPIAFMGHYYWAHVASEHVDLSQLIQERRLLPGQRSDLDEFLAEWLHKGYEKSRPLWHCILYKDEDEHRGKTFLAFKMSHVLGDAESIRMMLRRFLDGGTESPQVLTAAPPSGGGWISVADKLKFLFLGPYITIQCLLRITPRGRGEYLNQLPKVTDSVVTMGSFKLQTIKTIRRAHGCKFNEVLLSILTNALRRLTLENIPESELAKFLPIAVSFNDPTHGDELANLSAVLMFRVPLKGSSAKERFEGLRKEGSYLYRRADVHKLTYWLTQASYWVPNWLSKPSPNFDTPVCCGLTAIPGLLNPTTLFGLYPLKHLYPLTGLQMKCLAISAGFISREDEIDFGLFGNKGVFPTQSHLKKLSDYIQEEMGQMLSSTLNQPRDGVNVAEDSISISVV